MRAWKHNIVLMLGGVLIALLLCEIVLRMTSISWPSFYQPDTELGASLIPGAEGWWTKEGNAYVRINSAGLRDREHAHTKPAHTLRIAVLGDSFAEALQVPMEEAFWSVLERELEGCPSLAGREPEVINFGVSGYGSAQELLMLRHRVWSYDPDIVLLAFFPGNDVRNNSRVLEPEDMRPFFVFKNRELIPDFTFRNSARFRSMQTWVAWWKHRIKNASRIYQLLSQVRAIVTTRRDGLIETGLDSMVYVEPRDQAWKEAWEVTDGLVLRMRDEVKAKGADFLVVTLSTGSQVHPDPAVRQSLEKRLGVSHLFYPDFHIRDLGQREGFSVLNLGPLFQSYAQEHRAFLHFENSEVGTGHWNKDGHHLAGTLITQKLCGDLLRKTSSSSSAAKRQVNVNHP